MAAKIKAMAAKNCDATYPPQVAGRARLRPSARRRSSAFPSRAWARPARCMVMAVAYGGAGVCAPLCPDAGRGQALRAGRAGHHPPALQGADMPAMRVFRGQQRF